jgi:hypothetical protein
MSGIPCLQKALLEITAQQNLELYRKHFEKLTRILEKCKRDLHKSVEEGGYEKFHHSTIHRIQEYKSIINNPTIPAAVVSIPKILTYAQMQLALSRVKGLSKWKYVYKDIRWPTWFMMMRYNGIPTKRSLLDGKDVNYNRDLLDAIERPDEERHRYTSTDRPVEAWRDAMINNIEATVRQLQEPIALVCREIQKDVDQVSVSQYLATRISHTWTARYRNLKAYLEEHRHTVEKT